MPQLSGTVCMNMCVLRMRLPGEVHACFGDGLAPQLGWLGLLWPQAA
jgi:hypothetical protein